MTNQFDEATEKSFNEIFSMEVQDLERGFYWVLILNDPDAEDWEKEWMPARYMGDGNWFYIGADESTDWKPSFIGDKIEHKGE